MNAESLLRPARSMVEQVILAFGARGFNISWITSGLAVSRAPRRGDWKKVAAEGIQCVVDLRAEILGNGDMARRYGIEYLRLPIEEYTAPTEAVLERLTAWIFERVSSGRSVLIFCREGRGRSPLTACGTLLQMGWGLPSAYLALKRARPDAAFTKAQHELLIRFAEGLTARRQPKITERPRTRRPPGAQG